jgi:hypothetical protein
MYCRDHFRLEITQTTLSLFVNGDLYFKQTDVPPLPDELLNNDIYVYFASMVVSHPAEAIRFHWDALAVNPVEQTPENNSVYDFKDTSVCESYYPGE